MAIAESKIEIVKLLLAFESIDINCKNVFRDYIHYIRHLMYLMSFIFNYLNNIMI